MSEHGVCLPPAEFHDDVLSDTSPDEVPGRGAAEVVRGPAEQAGTDDSLEPIWRLKRMRPEQQAIDVKGLTGECSVAMQVCLQLIRILATLTIVPGAVGRGHRLSLEHTRQGTVCKNGDIRASTWTYWVFTVLAPRPPPLDGRKLKVGRLRARHSLLCILMAYACS